MGKWIALRSIVFDTQVLRPGMTTLHFFGERVEHPGVDSVTSPVEAVILKWLLETPATRGLILDELGLDSHSKYSIGVRSPFTSRDTKPGDIDGILCDLSRPHESVALECKRVKVTTLDQGDQRINKLSEFGRAYHQANGLARLGFNRAFLTAIAVVDGRDDPRNNFVFRGTSTQTFRRLYDVAWEIPLAPEVGLLYVEIAQPVAAAVSTAGMLSVGVLRAPPRIEQGHHFSELVRNYLIENGQPKNAPNSTAERE